MSFESRIERRRQLIESEKQRKAAAAKEAEQAYSLRVEEIKKDPRFLEMMELANSPELREALEAFSSKYSHDPEDVRIESNWEGPTQNRPLGTIWVKVSLGSVSGFYSSSGEGASGDGGEWTREVWERLGVTWFSKAESRIQVQTFRSVSYEGIDAEPGLGIIWGSDENYKASSPPVFKDLESLLDFIAETIVNNKPRF